MAEVKTLELNIPKPLTYLCKFDEQGRRGETRLSVDYTDEQKKEMIADGFVEIDEDEWSYYVGNHGMGDNGTGYIRVDGKPVSAPPYAPSKAEKLASLEAEYKEEKAKLEGYFTIALLMDDTDTQAELKEELADLDSWYQEEYEATNNG